LYFYQFPLQLISITINLNLKNLWNCQKILTFFISIKLLPQIFALIFISHLVYNYIIFAYFYIHIQDFYFNPLKKLFGHLDFRFLIVFYFILKAHFLCKQSLNKFNLEVFLICLSSFIIPIIIFSHLLIYFEVLLCHILIILFINYLFYIYHCISF
jgi:hypothetical protein